MSGIFAASLFLCSLNWLFVILANTASGDGPSPFLTLATRLLTFPDGTWLTNFLLAAFLSLTAWFYMRCMCDDPGFVPKMNGIAEQKAVIDELIGLWKFDESNFCVTCMIRTPLRSKHCRRCQRCVARHDQYVDI